MRKSENVDFNEIRKFEELASRWWDRNSEFKPLHDINPLRANWIDNLAPVAEQDLLDVGCGGGMRVDRERQDQDRGAQEPARERCRIRTISSISRFLCAKSYSAKIPTDRTKSDENACV